MPGTNEGIWIIDNTGNTVYVNQRMAEMLGTSPEDMVGRSSFDYVFPEDAEEAQRLFASKQRGDIDGFRFKLRRSNGEATCVRVQGTPLRNAEGEFSGIVGTFREAP